MTTVVHCGECAFWVRHGTDSGTCRQRAPLPADGPDQIVHWPTTLTREGCGDGVRPGPGVPTQTVCGECRFWHTNPGRGLDPFGRGDARREWWFGAGHCLRHAPVPSSVPGYRAFWRATHSTGSCAEGDAVTD